MEEKKVKLSTVIILLLLIVIIAGGIGRCIYNMKPNKTNTSNIENNNNLVKEEIQSKPAENEDKNTENVELSDQEKFDNYINTYKNDMKKILNERYKGDEENSTNDDVIYSYYLDTYDSAKNTSVELTKDGTVNLVINQSSELYSKYGSKYKIAESVASMYMCQVGQDDNFDLVMLGLDGSAKSLFMLEDELLKGINVKNIDVKYAINVVPYNNGAATYGIIDINGNIISR